MAAPVRIEAQRQAMRAKHFVQRTERQIRALFLNQKGRIDRVRGIVHGHDQIERGWPPSHACREPSWCSIMPGNGRRGRLRRCAPRFFAFSSKPFECRNVFVQVYPHANL